MSQTPKLDAQARHDLGKAATRRLRRLEDRVPAIIYGEKGKPQPVSLAHNKLMHALQDETLYASVFVIDVDGSEERVLLKALHRHPCKRQILHLDLQRVTETTLITKTVPLNIINADKAKGIKMGGKLVRRVVKVDVSCPANKLPSELVLDIASVGIGQVLHLSDIPLPEGVSLTVNTEDRSKDLPVVAIEASRKSAASPADNS